LLLQLEDDEPETLQEHLSIKPKVDSKMSDVNW